MTELLSVTDAAVKALGVSKQPIAYNNVMKSTLPGIDAYNSSFDKLNSSASSKASSCSSSFLSGNAKAVKVSKRRLKEIKSPFDATGKLENIQDSPSNTMATLPAQCKDTSYTFNGESEQRVNCLEYFNKLQTADNGLSSGKAVLDSGYLSAKLAQMESTEDKQLMDNCNLTGDNLVTSEEFDQNTERSGSSQHLITSKQQDGERQMGIITVTESIVTVNAQDPSQASETSVSSENTCSEQLAQSRQHRFAQFHTASLKQGQLTNKQDAICGSQQSDDEVHIAKLSLTDRERAMKQAITSKQQGNIAMKKKVQPTLVKASKPSEPVTDQPNAVDALTTAAVAAASAVAATQPFLKAQQQMDNRLAVVLDKLSAVQAAPPHHDCAPHCTDRLVQLERELTDVREQRLERLEAMQQQQLNWQAHLLAVNQRSSQPCLAPSGVRTQRLETSHLGDASRLCASEKSLLDTPAPRDRHPMPTSFDMSHESRSQTSARPVDTAAKKNGGLLEEILSAQNATPKKSPFASTPDRPYNSSQTDPQVAALLHDVDQLKQHMKQAIEYPARTAVGQRVSTTDGTTAAATAATAAPLDEFMLKMRSAPATSHSPPERDTNPGDAPVVTYYSDAKSVLSGVRQHRANLEANLDTIVRARQQTDVYSLIDQLTRDSNAIERRRIKKMVDDQIQKLNGQLQKEVLEDLTTIKDRPKSTLTTARAKNVQRGKTTGQAKVPLKVAAKVNAGVGAPKLGTEGRHAKNAGKENLSHKSNKRAAMLLGDESYVERVYGKQPYQNQRSTTREPYLRYQTTSKPKSPVRPNRAVPLKGVTISTAKTQTGIRHNNQLQSQYYFDPTDNKILHQVQQQGKIIAPSQGRLIPMAIPLGMPRKEGTIEVPASGIPIVTSTPAGNHQKVKDSPKVAVRRTSPKLTQQTMAPVNIEPCLVNDDTCISPIVAAKPTNTSQTQNKQEKHVEEVSDDNSGDDEDDDDVDMTMTTEGTPVTMPGCPPRPAKYNGPAFPPQAPAIEKPTSDVIARDIQQRDLLENKALDWIEQELMAHVITEMYDKQREQSAICRPESEPSDSMSLASEEDALVVRALGERGIQLFVDAGQPVNDQLAHALIKEAILEKLSAMTGQRTTVPENRDVDAAAAATVQIQPEEHVTHTLTRVSSSPLSTPLPTPSTSLDMSSHVGSERSASVVVTPQYTPIPSITDDATEADANDMSEKDMEPEEVWQSHQAKKPPGEVATVQREEIHELRHDVPTPPITPPPSPSPPLQAQPHLMEILSNVVTPEPSLVEQLPDKAPIVSPRKTPIASPRKPAIDLSTQAIPPLVPEEPDASPQPWAEPGTTTQQENPWAETLPISESLPAMQHVVQQAKDELESSVESIPANRPSNGVKRLSSSSSMETIPSSITPISETAPDPISEGQWLISLRSEGECVANDSAYDRVLREGVAGCGLQTIDDLTLYGMADIAQDQSEGEVPLGGYVPPAQTPFLSTLANLRHPRLISQRHQPMGQSLGEIHPDDRTSYGQVNLSRMMSLGEIPDFSAAAARPKHTATNSQPSVHKRVTPQPSGSGPEVRRSLTRSHPSLGQVVSTRTSAVRQQKPARSFTASEGEVAPLRQSEEMAETTANRLQQSVTPRDLDSMTPDQMNVDVLLQTRDYFAADNSDNAVDEAHQSSRLSHVLSPRGAGVTFGTTSDLSLPTDLAASVDGPQDRTGERQLQEYFQSLQLRRSSDCAIHDDDVEEQEARTAPRQVAVMIPSVDLDESDSDVSEIAS